MCLHQKQQLQKNMYHQPVKSTKFYNNDKFHLNLLLGSSFWKREWCAPKFLVRPKEGPTMLKSGNSWNLVPLPASNTKRGERGVLKAPGLD